MKDQIEKMVSIIRQSRDDAVKINPKIAAHFEGIAARVEYAFFLFESKVMSFQSLDDVLQVTVADYEMTVQANQWLYGEKIGLN